VGCEGVVEVASIPGAQVTLRDPRDVEAELAVSSIGHHDSCRSMAHPISRPGWRSLGDARTCGQHQSKAYRASPTLERRRHVLSILRTGLRLVTAAATWSRGARPRRQPLPRLALGSRTPLPYLA
jgi:hypothetical protein